MYCFEFTALNSSKTNQGGQIHGAEKAEKAAPGTVTVLFTARIYPETGYGRAARKDFVMANERSASSPQKFSY